MAPFGPGLEYSEVHLRSEQSLPSLKAEQDEPLLQIESYQDDPAWK